MSLNIVLCPDKRCGHEFPTEKEEPQCGKCGLRFHTVSNSIISSKTQDVKSRERKQIKKIDDLLTKLSNKYIETGVTIQQMQNIAKEVIKK